MHTIPTLKNRLLPLLALLLPLAFWACDGGPSIESENGVSVVRNAGEGLQQGDLATLETVWQTGTVEGDEMYFSTIMSIDFDEQGNLYVLDFRDQALSKLDPQGNLLIQFANQGQGPGELTKSRDLDWVDGRILVANEGNGRIEVFTDEGEALEPIRLERMSLPGYVFEKGGQIYVGKRFVPEGHFLVRYEEGWSDPVPLKPAPPMEERLDYLRTHYVPCPSGDGVWLVYLLLDKIEKIDEQGNTVLTTTRQLDWDFPKDDKGQVIPEILVTRNCAVDPEGNLHVIYSNPEDWKRGNDVYRFDPEGRLLGKAFTLPIHRATALTFDSAGDLYYSDGITLYKARVRPATAE